MYGILIINDLNEMTILNSEKRVYKMVVMAISAEQG